MAEKKKAVFVHGLGGTHPLHWQAWIKKELEKKGVQTAFPLLPRPFMPRKAEWVEGVKKAGGKLSENTIMFGHSLGVPTILHVLEGLEKEEKIKAAFLVAGFCRPLGLNEVEEFVVDEFDCKKIKENCGKFFVVYSDNDPFIPVEESLYLSEKLGVKGILEKNGSHITAPDFGPYPKLLKLAEKEFGV